MGPTETPTQVNCGVRLTLRAEGDMTKGVEVVLQKGKSTSIEFTSLG